MSYLDLFQRYGSPSREAEIRAKYGSTTFRRGVRTESDALPA